MREMLLSKKFQAAVAAIVVWLVGYVGLDADLETVGPIVVTILVYIGSQGVADHGKGAEVERTRRAERANQVQK